MIPCVFYYYRKKMSGCVHQVGVHEHCSKTVLRPFLFSLHAWCLKSFLFWGFHTLSLLLFPLLHFPLPHFQRPLRDFGDKSRQSIAVVLITELITKRKCTTGNQHKHWRYTKKTHTKPRPTGLSSHIRIAHNAYAYDCVQLWCTIQHKTVW